MRDVDAGLKLKTALLEIGIARPEGFSAKQLSEVAEVGYETARDFLKPSTGSEYTEITATPLAEPISTGRPPTFHKLTPNGRLRLMSEVARLRRQLSKLPEETKPRLQALENFKETVADVVVASGEDQIRLMDEAALELRRSLKEFERIKRDHPVEGGTYKIRLESIVGELNIAREAAGLPADFGEQPSLEGLVDRDDISADDARQAIAAVLPNLTRIDAERIVVLVARCALSAVKSGQPPRYWSELLRECRAFVERPFPGGAEVLDAIDESILGRRGFDIGRASADEIESTPTVKRGKRSRASPANVRSNSNIHFASIPTKTTDSIVKYAAGSNREGSRRDSSPAIRRARRMKVHAIRGRRVKIAALSSERDR